METRPRTALRAGPLCWLFIAMLAACDPTQTTAPDDTRITLLDAKGGKKWDQPWRPGGMSMGPEQGLTSALQGSTKLHIQLGLKDPRPPAFVEALFFRADAEARTASLTALGVSSAGSAADPEPMQDFQDQVFASQTDLSGHGFEFTGFSHDYPLSAGDLAAQTLRVYDHGQCSVFEPWNQLFTTLGQSLFKEFACEALGHTGVDKAVRDVTGLYPTFQRAQGTWAPSDGFALYGFYTLDVSVFSDERVAFFQQYGLEVETGSQVPHTVKVVPLGSRRVESDNTDIEDGLGDALGTRVPETIARNLNERLTQSLPGKLLVGHDCPTGQGVCGGPPTPCNATSSAPGVEATKCLTETVKNVLRPALALGELKVPDAETDAWLSDFRASDFACVADAASATGGSCRFHVPVERVNVLPDGFELVFRQNPNPKHHDVVEVLSALNRQGGTPGSIDHACDLNRFSDVSNESQRPFTTWKEERTSLDSCP
ncbi:hypothetical protein LZ198_37620 [Myxococcus sp. K15C18031901]|uniref:hypothetical protein n=1 Tax=Myxococcus dinghuensis TaxID=2906761 RepID=UPI0020A7E005|nr:hypothetical protein [Myxococcus dinghuensis]MCP3104598.1 hypothetical protein [Myxococcus dinghuensis]